MKVVAAIIFLAGAAALTAVALRRPPEVPRFAAIQGCKPAPAITYTTLLAVQGAVEGYGRLNGIALKGEIAGDSIRFVAAAEPGQALANFDGILGFFTLMERLPWHAHYAAWCVGKQCDSPVAFTLSVDEGKRTDEVH